MSSELDKLLAVMFQAHPWHGVAPGDPAGVVNAFIEIVPTDSVKRLRHYFLTCKQMPGAPARTVRIAEVYDRVEAVEVIRRSLADDREGYCEPEDRAAQLARLLGRGA